VKKSRTPPPDKLLPINRLASTVTEWGAQSARLQPEKRFNLQHGGKEQEPDDAVHDTHR